MLRTNEEKIGKLTKNKVNKRELKRMRTRPPRWSTSPGNQHSGEQEIQNNKESDESYFVPIDWDKLIEQHSTELRTKEQQEAAETENRRQGDLLWELQQICKEYL